MRPIELVRQLFGSISPTYLNEAVDIGRELDDPARIITTTNLDPRQVSKLVQDAAAGSGRIARETGSKLKNDQLEYSRYGRGSNTEIKSIRQAEDAFGRRFDVDNPVTLYGSSPVLSGMDGSSSFDLVIPQTKQIADFVENRFNPSQPINPLIISDGNQFKGFLPVDRVAAANLNPRRVIAGEEQKNKVLNTLKTIIESPYIPTAAKEQLLKVTQNDIFGGIRNIGDNDNLGLDFGNLERFASALRNDKTFTKGLGKGEYDELVWLSKQMSGAKTLDNTLNNQFTRLKGDNLLAGMAFDYDPETKLFLTPQYQKPSINLDGATFQVNQESLAKDIAAANQRRESYKPQPISEGQFFIDPQQTNLTGKTPFAKQIGRGNVIFSNELIDPNAAQGIQMGYVNALETGINELLKQNVKTIKSSDGNARTFLKKDTLPELTPDLPAGTLGYTVIPETIEGAIRNVPRLGLVTKNPVTGQSSIQLARQDRPILFSSGKDAAGFNFVDENDIYYPLGDIQRTTQRVLNDDGTEEVVDDLMFPSPIASLVAGRVQYNRPDELESINKVFRDGEDKLKALAKVAMMPIPEAVDGKVQFPVAMKRLARNTDNFLASELPEDAQSQLLAQALNYGSPNFGRLQNLGINPTPESNVAKALKSNILDEPTAVTVMPISWDIKDQTQVAWDDLYAAQLLDPQGKVADSIVIPYNEAVGNPKLLGSVQKAYKNSTGNDPEVKWLDTPDGNVIAYIGNTPSQVRSFPDWNSPDRSREPLVDTRKIENTLLSWLGAKDAEMIGDAPSTAPINMQNIDQVLYEVAKNPQTRDRTMSGNPVNSQPVVISADIGEYVDGGRKARRSSYIDPSINPSVAGGVYDEVTNKWVGSMQAAPDFDLPLSADMRDNNLGEPQSNFEFQLAATLKALTDQKYRRVLNDDNLPVDNQTLQRFVEASKTGSEVELSPDEVYNLANYISDNQLTGYGNNIIPFDTIKDEARGLFPEKVPISRDANGNIIRVYAPTNKPFQGSAAIRNTPENLSNQMLDTRLVGLVDQGAAIRNGFESYDSRNAVYTPQQMLERYNNQALAFSNFANRAEDPAQTALMSQRAELAQQNASILQRQLDNDALLQSNTESPEEERYFNLAVNALKKLNNIQPSDAIGGRALKAEEIWANPNLTQEQKKRAVLSLANQNKPAQLSSQDYWKNYSTPESEKYNQITWDLYKNNPDMSEVEKSKFISDPINFLVDKGYLRHSVQSLADATKKQEAYSNTMLNLVDSIEFEAKRNQANQDLMEYYRRQGVPEDQVMRNVKSYNRYINKTQEIYSFHLRNAQDIIGDIERGGYVDPEKASQTLGFLERQLDQTTDPEALAAYQNLYNKISSYEMPKPVIKDNLSDLNTDNASISAINEYLPIEQQIQTSDGYTSINEPAIWRNDSVGWSDNSTLEPSVTYELTDPENVAIRRDGLPPLRVNNNYLRQVKEGDLIDDELVRGDGTYIDVPQSVDDAVSEWNDRIAANERVDDSSLVNAILDNRFVVDQNILDSERQFYPPIESIRTQSPLQQSNRQLIDEIIAASPQNVARRNESIRQANIKQPAVVPQPNQSTQQPMVTREAVALRPEQRNSVGGTDVIAAQSTPVIQGFDWNNLSQEQKLMLLGLGGLSTYGLYDAVNQPQQQSYAVR